MILKVSITNQISKGMVVAHNFEQVIDDIEEATQFGEQCAHLMKAFSIGFGDANLEGE